MRKLTAYLVDSIGTFTKVASPMLLPAMADVAEYQKQLDARLDPSGSKRLRQKYGVVIDGVTCAPRPFDFGLFAYATTLNTYHARAVRAKAKDIVGRPWKITGDGSETSRGMIERFFRRAFQRRTFSRGMQKVWCDYEALGNAFLEVIPARGDGKTPAAFEHVPATQVWMRLDGLGFVQQLNGEYSHFRDFFVDQAGYQELPAADPLAAAQDRTSIIAFTQESPWSPYYGIPSILSAWPAVCMMQLIAEFNLRFFSNNAVPDYLVLVDGEAGEDTVDKIREYFRAHIQGQAHKTLILEAPQGTKIIFQALQTANKEGAFRLMRLDCRDEVVSAHGVPPQKVGIIETGKLGGNLSTEQAEEYKTSIVEPGQETVAAAMTAVIERGFEIDDLAFEFAPYDIADQQVEANIDATYLDRNVLVPNEVRKRRFPELPPTETGDEPLRTATLSDVAALDEGIVEMQKLARAAVDGGK